MTILSLHDQKEKIMLLIDYAAPKNQISKAKNFVEQFKNDRVALNIFQEFYSFLPEGLNDLIVTLKLITQKDSTFLLLAATGLSRYLYLANQEKAVFMGCLKDGVLKQEVLDYFQINQADLSQSFNNTDKLAKYISLELTPEYCYACSTASGGYHRLGCPVEICPWCAGQLVHCSCRFDHLGIDQLNSNKQIDQFLNLLNKKGRIPFTISQQPGGLKEA